MDQIPNKKDLIENLKEYNVSLSEVKKIVLKKKKGFIEHSQDTLDGKWKGESFFKSNLKKNGKTQGEINNAVKEKKNKI